MAYRNLDEFLTRLEQAGDVAHFTIGQPDFHVPEIATQDLGKVQLFSDSNGTRVVRNLFGTSHRVQQALRVASLDLIAGRLEQLLEVGKPGALGAMISRAMTMFSAIRTTNNRRAPSEYQNQPFNEWRSRLLEMRDIAGSLTLHATLLTGGDTPRMMAVAGEIGENNIVGQFWPPLEVGEHVALVIGGDPAFMFAAHAPLPDVIHRSYFASWLRDKPLDMMRLPGLDIDIPANVECVIAGAIGSQDAEGTILDVVSVWTKPGAIYLQTLPDECEHLRNASAKIMLPLIRQFLPGVQNIRLSSEFGILTVKPAQANTRAIFRQLWAVPISANVYYWLLLPDTDDINGAVEGLVLDDIKSLSKLVQGKDRVGILLDASSKREPWSSSEPDAELEQIFWHFKRNWRHESRA